jgi:hypothetical protein
MASGLACGKQVIVLLPSPPSIFSSIRSSHSPQTRCTAESETLSSDPLLIIVLAPPALHVLINVPKIAEPIVQLMGDLVKIGG